jgi:hypothetical protein
MDLSDIFGKSSSNTMRGPERHFWQLRICTS